MRPVDRLPAAALAVALVCAAVLLTGCTVSAGRAVEVDAAGRSGPSTDRSCRDATDSEVECESTAAVTMRMAGIRYERRDSGWSRVEEERCPPESGPSERSGPFRIPPPSNIRDADTPQRAGQCPKFTPAMIAAVVPQVSPTDRIFEVRPRGATSAGATMVEIEFESSVIEPHHRIVKSLSCDCFAGFANCMYFRQDKVFGTSPFRVPYSFTLGKDVSVDTAVEIQRLFDARAIDASEKELQRNWALDQGIDQIRRCGDRYFLDWSAGDTGGSRTVRLEGEGANRVLRSVEPAEWYCAYTEPKPVE